MQTLPKRVVMLQNRVRGRGFFFFFSVCFWRWRQVERHRTLLPALGLTRQSNYCSECKICTFILISKGPGISSACLVVLIIKMNNV